VKTSQPPAATSASVGRTVLALPARWSTVLNAALWAAPLAVFWACYHEAINAWWMADDSAILLSVIRFGALAHWIRPNVDIEIAASNLTPWLYTSYAIDFAIAGLEPRAAYIHHLLVWFATLVVLTLLLRPWLGASVTAVVIVWFILAVPTGSIVQLLCTRHYLEGLLLALLSILAYSAYRLGGRARYLWISAALYAWAMTAKEIYVPLGPMLVLHHALYDPSSDAPLGTWSAALRAFGRRLVGSCVVLWPFFALIAAYVVWRGYMLGFDRLLAGYDDPASRATPALALTLPTLWKESFRWARWQTGLWMLVFVSALIGWVVFRAPLPRSRAVLFGSAVAAATLLPVYPVLGFVRVNIHYLFLPGLAFFVLAGWTIRQIDQGSGETVRAGRSPVASALMKYGRFAVVMIVVFLVFAQYRTEQRGSWLWSEREYVEQYRVEGQYELYSNDRSLVLDAVGPPWHHRALQWIRRIWLHSQEGPLACAGEQCKAMVAQIDGQAGVCKRYASVSRQLETVSCTSQSRTAGK